MSKLKDVRDLRMARKEAGYSLATLALKTGIDKGDLSRFESGVRALPKHHAETLAGVLKSTNSETLLFGNRAAIVEKAIAENDPGGVMVGAESAMNLAEGKDLNDEGEEALAELMESAERFMKALAKKSHEPQDGEQQYGTGGHDGRDRRGRYVGVEAAIKDWHEGDEGFTAIWGSAVGPDRQSPEEYEAAVDDGRDPVTGHRIAPFEYEDDDNEDSFYDFEEYEDE